MAISISPVFPRAHLFLPNLRALLFFLRPVPFWRLLFCASSHLDIPQDRTHRITFSLLSFPLLPYPSITRRDAHHRLARFDLRHLLIHLNFIPGLDLEAQ